MFGWSSFQHCSFAASLAGGYGPFILCSASYKAVDSSLPSAQSDISAETMAQQMLIFSLDQPMLILCLLVWASHSQLLAVCLDWAVEIHTTVMASCVHIHPGAGCRSTMLSILLRIIFGNAQFFSFVWCFVCLFGVIGFIYERRLGVRQNESYITKCLSTEYSRVCRKNPRCGSVCLLVFS